MNLATAWFILTAIPADAIPAAAPSAQFAAGQP